MYVLVLNVGMCMFSPLSFHLCKNLTIKAECHFIFQHLIRPRVHICKRQKLCFIVFLHTLNC